MATDSVSPYYSPFIDRTATTGTPVASTGYARYTSGINMVPNNVGLPAYSGSASSAQIQGVTGPPYATFGSSGGTLYAPTANGGTSPVTVSGMAPSDTSGVSQSPGVSAATIVG